MLDPIADFGLVKVNTSEKYRITLENTSPVPAEVLIRSVRNKDVNFDTVR